MKLNFFKTLSLTIIWTWLIVFALVPFLMIFVTSFLSSDLNHLIRWHFTLQNYQALFNFIYVKVFLRSILLAGVTTISCLILGFPFAYAIAKSRHKNLLLLLLMVPFWTSSVIRSFAMSAILQTKGIINSVLLFLGVIHQPLTILYTNVAVTIGLTYNLLPFMILPIYANLTRLDKDLIAAAEDLGATTSILFRRVIIPLTMPGILAGCLMVFLPAMTLFYIPDILGGAKSMLLGNLIQDQFLISNNWPMGATLSVILTVIMGILLWLYWLKAKNETKGELF